LVTQVFGDQQLAWGHSIGRIVKEDDKNP